MFGDADSLGAVAECAHRLQCLHEPVSYRLRWRCAWRGCGWVLDVRSRSGWTGCFCPPHAAELARIRAELEARAEPHRKRGRRPKALREHLAESPAELLDAA